MERIQLAYGLPKETVTVSMIKHVSSGGTNFFDNVTTIFQRDILALNMFIIGLDNVLWTSIDLIKEKDFIG